MKLAYFMVSHELLADLLKLSPGARITHVHQGMGEQKDGCFEVYVTHESLPDVPAGENIPQVSPVVRVRYEWDWQLETLNPKLET